MSAILGTGSLQAAGAVIENQSREIVSLYAGKTMKNLIIIVHSKEHVSLDQPLNL